MDLILFPSHCPELMDTGDRVPGFWPSLAGAVCWWHLLAMVAETFTQLWQVLCLQGFLTLALQALIHAIFVHMVV